MYVSYTDCFVDILASENPSHMQITASFLASSFGAGSQTHIYFLSQSPLFAVRDPAGKQLDSCLIVSCFIAIVKCRLPVHHNGFILFNYPVFIIFIGIQNSNAVT